jgi:predicted DNA-binding transcriptional regulator AlpA
VPILTANEWNAANDLAVWTARQLVKGLSQLLTRQDIARMCQISQRTLSEWMQAGRIPAPIYVAPHAPRWCPHDIERWLKRRRSISQRSINRPITD